MPRVANNSRSHLGTTRPSQSQSPLKIPLNDDRHEKAIRFQSRQALHDIQINQIKAAASPVRKGSGHGRSSPKTPQSQALRGKENNEPEPMLAIVPGHSMTPMKRMPILANFEEWMKMATDNKINATNSWNFALIDYFHDMSLLKEGDGVNFQKASCTLDGCVKIYTSRVDSVATETGKLLSGLADGSAKKSARSGQGSDEAVESEDEDSDEGQDGARRRTRRKAQRSSEATLVPSFAQLQLRKFELEFTVDPLFKKASADFDEGGAKGLLLNHLAVDAYGRIVFDSSDENQASVGEEKHPMEEDALSPSGIEKIETPETNAASESSSDIDLAGLGLKYFAELSLLDEQDICPSLRNFDLGDPNADFDVLNLKGMNNEGNSASVAAKDDTSPVEFDGDADDIDTFSGGFDVPLETGFGDGGDFWAKDLALQPIAPMHGDSTTHGDVESDETGNLNTHNSTYAVSLSYEHRYDGRESLLTYFDKCMSTNWAGPEHWRIRRIKDNAKVDNVTPSRRKEKDPFEVDFAPRLEPAAQDLLYTIATSNSAIALPKTQWKSKTRNLLPDDKHFNSRQLLRLFLKPQAQVGVTRARSVLAANKHTAPGDSDIDEAYWARQAISTGQAMPTDVPTRGDYDANFFQDDGLAFANGLPDDDEFFADARESFSPGIEAAGVLALPQSDGLDISADDAQGTFGSQLVTQTKRLRPEYVQYARVAKKVDVRRLKEEMWKGIGFEETQSEIPSRLEERVPEEHQWGETLQFTTVMNNLQEVYPKQAMADISTSFCFICLLHLANEKGLRLDNDQGLEELMIRRDSLL